MIESDVTVNVFLLSAILGLAVFIGYLLKGSRVAKKNARIRELEEEMMQAHAEILQIQKEYCTLRSSIQDPSSPVISMKLLAKEDSGTLAENKPPENSPDGKNKRNRTA